MYCIPLDSKPIHLLVSESGGEVIIVQARLPNFQPRDGWGRRKQLRTRIFYTSVCRFEAQEKRSKNTNYLRNIELNSREPVKFEGSPKRELPFFYPAPPPAPNSHNHPEYPT
jgi:hypothetical protein